MSTSTTGIDQIAINTIRTLSMDAVQAANSGHPGTPMALAPVTYVLWNEYLKYDPAHANWPARDRFVLSCGHASMLLYSVLHLTQVKKQNDNGQPTGDLGITLDDIKNFRQLHSPCAGHPEFGEAPGIETTTGPLGQGVANSVGMAMAAGWIDSNYGQNKGLFSYDVYALCSDGDVMEGVGCEAASIAGHLGLSNLCWIYDDNHITIEGHTDLAFTENVGQRFEALGWNVEHVNDANDLDSIRRAFDSFKNCNDQPTIIVLKSIIGYGAPNKQDTHGAHGAPLGEDEIRLAKEFYGVDPDAKFEINDDVYEHFAQGIGARGQAAFEQWQSDFDAFKSSSPQQATEFETMTAGQLPADFCRDIPVFEADAKGMATRKSSGAVLNAIAELVPWMIGGSADLAPSNNTELKFDGAGEYSKTDRGGRNLHFGVREHAMASICNGLSLSGLRAYAGTFFVFTDYMRPAMRLASIMNQGVLYVLTHDSIGLGEDGPTHQPVEHLAACRSIPGLYVMRPGDANEVAECYRAAMNIKTKPTAMILTRQNVPTLDRNKCNSIDGVSKGAYTLWESTDNPDVIIMGTGSELYLALEAGETLAASGTNVRVVSMPCFELFEEQDQTYRDSVLPPAVTKRVAIEAGVQQCWDRYLGTGGKFIGMNGFGASAPYEELYQHFGITAKAVVGVVKSM